MELRTTRDVEAERAKELLEAFSTYFGERSVEEYQRILKELGYYWGPIDGIVGKKTLQGLDEFLKVHQYDIKEVQRLLNQLAGKKLKVDGLFGRKTRRALRKFLEEQGLSWKGDVEGIKAFLELVKEKPIPSREERVRRKQELINQFYFIQGMGKEIKVDGIEGPETARAEREVRRILKRMGMGWEHLEEYVGRATTLRSSRVKDLLPTRWSIFLRELEEVASYKGWNAEELLAYVEANAERAKAIWERTAPLAKGDGEVVMHIILSALVAEKAYGLPAEYTVAVAMAESGGTTIYGRNGQGVMQITRQSSVSDLRGKLKERVEVFIGRPIGDAVSYGLAHRGILWNVLAGAETILMKLYLLKRRPEEVYRVARRVAELYNGHPRYSKAFGRRVYAYLSNMGEVVA